MSQMLLFPDPRPLVERLGAAFFQQAPVGAGVYVMRDETGSPLYVGKAGNLRRRLCSYRVANPERMPRRHLRMLRAVRKIDLIECADEAAASDKEAELLLAWKPKFNRAGVWPAKEQFILWRLNEDRLDMAIADSRLEGWESRSMFGGGAGFLLASVARILRCALHRKNDGEQFPAGWLQSRFRHAVSIRCGLDLGEASSALSQLFSGEAEVFCNWAQERIDAGAHRVHAAILQDDLEAIPQYNFRP
ncbi:MAG TPA: nucleotide excision repair endonuclease [Verrucomicrobiae bacterium]|nr:nucleotide excision repair endonuclease [Verrucomicrobiae bacterium]